MNEQNKQTDDKTSIMKDINEREQIIMNYRFYGCLDRNKAVEKIKELRSTDKDIAKATIAKLSVSSIPFCQASDLGIVAELQMQVDILTAKLLRNRE